MLLDKETTDFLRGDRFSNGRLFSVPPQGRIVSRNDRLVEIARGKSVLHWGCCDHPELIEAKIREGRYLHQLLHEAARSLVGVDINEHGLKKMYSMGFHQVHLPSELPGREHDILIAADVIEHVADVVGFLRNIRSCRFDQLVITTPNGLCRNNRLTWNGELINTDHFHWFTPYTLAKTLTNSGFKLKSIEYTDNSSKRRWYKNILLKRYPVLQDGLLAIACA